jgi:hypothetical protein
VHTILKGTLNCADCGTALTGQVFSKYKGKSYCEQCAEPITTTLVVLMDREPLLWTNDLHLAKQAAYDECNGTGLFFKEYPKRTWVLWDRSFQVKHHITIKDVRCMRINEERFARAIVQEPDRLLINGHTYVPVCIDEHRGIVWGNGINTAVEER